MKTGTAPVSNLRRVMRRDLPSLIVAAVVVLIPFAASAATRGYTGTQIFSTVGGDKDPGEPDHCGEPGGASSWFFYKAPRSGVMVVDTKGSSFDTVLAVYIGPGNSYATLTNVACNNDATPSNTWSKVVFNVTSNTMYYMAVDGVGGASGTVKLNYQLGDALTITAQPQSLVRATNVSATFTVAATGLTPLSYQWLFNGAAINGATQTTLTLPAVQAGQDGSYSVLVQDPGCSALSATAALVVCATLPGTNRVMVSQCKTNGVTYLRATGNAAVGSVLEASSNLQNWVPACTNQSSKGLFILDELLNQPQRFYRIRLGQ